MKRDRLTLARQYLQPMGIESWVLKVPVSTPAAPAKAANCVATVAEPVPVCQLRPTDLDQWLIDRRFQSLAAGDNGSLLLVMETPAVSAAADDLLASMLKAISLDIDSQPRVCLASDGQPLQIGAQTRAILLMARLAQASDVGSLSHLRQSILQHTGSGLGLAVTIHPNDLLENNAAKRPAWEDLKRLKGYLDELQR